MSTRPVSPSSFPTESDLEIIKNTGVDVKEVTQVMVPVFKLLENNEPALAAIRLGAYNPWGDKKPVRSNPPVDPTLQAVALLILAPYVKGTEVEVERGVTYEPDLACFSQAEMILMRDPETCSRAISDEKARAVLRERVRENLSDYETDSMDEDLDYRSSDTPSPSRSD